MIAMQTEWRKGVKIEDPKVARIALRRGAEILVRPVRLEENGVTIDYKLIQKIAEDFCRNVRESRPFIEAAIAETRVEHGNRGYSEVEDYEMVQEMRYAMRDAFDERKKHDPASVAFGAR